MIPPAAAIPLPEVAMSKPASSGRSHRRYGCSAAVLTFALAVAYLVTFGYTLTPKTRDGLLRQYSSALPSGSTYGEASDYLSSLGISEVRLARPFYEVFGPSIQAGPLLMDFIGDSSVTERAGLAHRDIARVVRVEYPTVTRVDLVTSYETVVYLFFDRDDRLIKPWVEVLYGGL